MSASSTIGRDCDSRSRSCKHGEYTRRHGRPQERTVLRSRLQRRPVPRRELLEREDQRRVVVQRRDLGTRRQPVGQRCRRERLRRSRAEQAPPGAAAARAVRSRRDAQRVEGHRGLLRRHPRPGPRAASRASSTSRSTRSGRSSRRSGISCSPPTAGSPVRCSATRTRFIRSGCRTLRSTRCRAGVFDLDAKPTFDEVLAVRRERMDRVAELVKGINADELNRQVPSPNGGMTSCHELPAHRVPRRVVARPVRQPRSRDPRTLVGSTPRSGCSRCHPAYVEHAWRYSSISTTGSVYDTHRTNGKGLHAPYQGHTHVHGQRRSSSGRPASEHRWRKLRSLIPSTRSPISVTPPRAIATRTSQSASTSPASSVTRVTDTVA